MRGLTGLLIAAGLGLAGALCNWMYLDSLASNEARLGFIGIRPDVRLNIGDVFKSEHFEPIEIPRSHLGNLQDTAPLWSAREAVIGLRANKPYSGGEIILRQDLETPAHQDLASLLADDEVARWVPIDQRAVMAEQINPGDLVSFETTGAGVPAPGQPVTGREVIGPFRVLAVGARRERPNVQQARGRSGSAEHTITIAVHMPNGVMEPRAVKLFEAVRTAGPQGVYVLLHSSR